MYTCVFIYKSGQQITLSKAIFCVLQAEWELLRIMQWNHLAPLRKWLKLFCAHILTGSDLKQKLERNFERDATRTNIPANLAFLLFPN